MKIIVVNMVCWGHYTGLVKSSITFFIYTYGIHISNRFSFTLFVLQVSVNTCVSFGHTRTSVPQLEYKYYQHTTGPQK